MKLENNINGQGQPIIEGDPVEAENVKLSFLEKIKLKRLIKNIQKIIDEYKEKREQKQDWENKVKLMAMITELQKIFVITHKETKEELIPEIMQEMTNDQLIERLEDVLQEGKKII